MGKLVHGIHHVALKCEGLAEFERVVAFYRDILDMEPVRTWGEGENVGIMLAAGSSASRSSPTPSIIPVRAQSAT